MVSTVGTCYPLWLRRLQQAGVAAAGFEPVSYTHLTLPTT